MSDITDVPPGISEDDQPHSDTSPAGAAEQLAGSGQPDLGGVAPRPVIAVALLTAHPGNVRRDLDLSPEFLASIEANGVLVPLRITSDTDGGYRVIDGHRRLAAAVRAGLAEVPADLAGDRAGDEPGQFLDMWTAHRHRNPLASIEEADALFAAREAGATRARIRKATGLKPAGVAAALAAAKLSPDTRSALDELDYQLSLDQLAVVAEFEGDSRAVSRLAAAARGGGFEHEAERLRQQRAEQAEYQRLRRELEHGGFTVTESLPPDAQPLTVLRHDGEELTGELHAACPGRGAFFRSWDLASPVHYCTSPAAHGHTFRYGDPAGPPAGTDSDDTPGPESLPDPPGPPGAGAPDPARRLVVQGNKAWKAASEVRRRWLTGLLARRTAPREVAQFVTGQLLAVPGPLRSGLAAAPSRPLFREITGQPVARMLETCATAATGRLPLLMLGPIVTAYEQALTEGEGRNTWRTDRYSPCPRDEAGRYLAFLGSLGYQLSGIEQAIADGTPYTGDTPPGDSLSADPDPDPDPGSDQPALAGQDVTGDADPGASDGRAADPDPDPDAVQAAA
jgi:ParB family chromosome partitioning protein